MPVFVFPPAPPVVLEVAAGGLFPVRRVYCVGRNYEAHVREMGGNPEREAPFFFSKPASAITSAPTVPYPPATRDLHHEGELVVAIGKGGADIEPARALDHVYGYAAGVDLTRRDLQSELRKVGRPWEMAKGFDFAGPCGILHPAADIGHPATGAITLSVNGAERQKGDLSEMIWSVPEVIGHLSRFVSLEVGDLIYTGTPEGVGPLVRGDRVEVRIAGVGAHVFTIV